MAYCDGCLGEVGCLTWTKRQGKCRQIRQRDRRKKHSPSTIIFEKYIEQLCSCLFNANENYSQIDLCVIYAQIKKY